MAITDSQSKPEGHDRLRQNAEAKIRTGTAPRTGSGNLDIKTLELLYQGALNPETAADALKFLHELQTHQVELDLLFEQLKANEQEQAEELDHYRTLFEHAPIAYLIVDMEWEVVEANEAAGELLKTAPGTLDGEQFINLFGANNVPALAKAMASFKRQLADNATPAELRLDLDRPDPVTIKAAYSPSRNCIFLLLGSFPATTPP
ncbi:PAS domain-containing protein [uncultured Marinobacter sp.]|uniref:PAS domain-containing protein n=1 Tax=uncultured Marinobacter sp. TaxID=187379 RepID=UPI0030D6EFB8